LKPDKPRGGEVFLFAVNSRETITKHLKFVSFLLFK
jgi:hypothetical protein